jgi:hypothetical protein
VPAIGFDADTVLPAPAVAPAWPETAGAIAPGSAGAPGLAEHESTIAHSTLVPRTEHA